MGQQRGLCFSNGSFSSSCLNTSERQILWGLIEQLCVTSVLSDSAARAGSALYPCEAISTKQEAKEVDKAQRRQMPRPETFAKIDECLRRRNAFAFVAAVARPGLLAVRQTPRAKSPRARGCPEDWAAGADLERQPRPPPGPRGPESGCIRCCLHFLDLRRGILEPST